MRLLGELSIVWFLGGRCGSSSGFFCFFFGGGELRRCRST